MIARRPITIAACCAVLAMASACGAAEQGSFVGAEQPQPAGEAEGEGEVLIVPSTTLPSGMPSAPSSTSPQSASVDEKPLPVDPSLYVNDNDPSTAIGAICWARREIVLSLADAVTPAGAERGIEANDLPTTLDVVQAELASVSDSLSKSPSGEFGQHLIEQIDAANQRNLRSLDASQTTVIGTEYFDFENYPGVEEYVKEATDSPSCSQI